MSDDIYCAVCGEAYDAHGVRRDGKGDMAGWEADLFLRGAGCPSCEGEGEVSEEKLEKHLSSLLMRGYDDFGHHDAVMEEASNVLQDKPRPKWEKPEDPLVWKCDGCEAEFRIDLDVSDDYEDRVYVTWPTGKWPQSYSLRREAEETEDPNVIKGLPNDKYCNACVTSCDICGAKLLTVDLPDIYTPGYSHFLQSSHKTVCTSCLEEKVCLDCEEEYEECACHEEEEQERDDHDNLMVDKERDAELEG